MIRIKNQHLLATVACVAALALSGLATASPASAATPSASPATTAPALLPIPLQAGVNNPNAVKLWQQDLNFYMQIKQTCRPTLTVDGQFGPATTSATKCFQGKSHLPQDGIVGAKTRSAMCTFLLNTPNDDTIWSETCVA